MKISKENIILGLLVIGFDEIDSALFTTVLNRFITDQAKTRQFEFLEKKTSNLFNQYISFNGIKYKIKDDYSLSDINLRKLLSQDKELMNYLLNLNYEELIIEKTAMLIRKGINNLNEFSNKEKEIIFNMYGVENIKQDQNIFKY